MLELLRQLKERWWGGGRFNVAGLIVDSRSVAIDLARKLFETRPEPVIVWRWNKSTGTWNVCYGIEILGVPYDP